MCSIIATDSSAQKNREISIRSTVKTVEVVSYRRWLNWFDLLLSTKLFIWQNAKFLNYKSNLIYDWLMEHHEPLTNCTLPVHISRMGRVDRENGRRSRKNGKSRWMWCTTSHYIMNVQSDGLRAELCLKMLPFLVKSFSTSCYNNVKHRNWKLEPNIYCTKDRHEMLALKSCNILCMIVSVGVCVCVSVFIANNRMNRMKNNWFSNVPLWHGTNLQSTHTDTEWKR